MGDPFGLELARERQRELLREAEERRTARCSAEVSSKRRGGRARRTGGTSRVLRCAGGLRRMSAAVAELLELNGMPRWISFEERFVVAERDGKVLGAVRYRTESKRLLLGLLVVDPWAGEERRGKGAVRGAPQTWRGSSARRRSSPLRRGVAIRAWRVTGGGVATGEWTSFRPSTPAVEYPRAVGVGFSRCWASSPCRSTDTGSG